MTDIFDAMIMCKECKREMQSTIVEKSGLELRAVKCSSCGDMIIHPADVQSYAHFNDIKGKTFAVKLRAVGNSHAISIPKEIVSFLDEMKSVHKEMNDMVRLCFKDFDTLSVRFGSYGDGR